jgi:hypothetical protein
MKGLLESLGMEVIGPAATVSEAEQYAAAQMPALALIDNNLKGALPVIEPRALKSQKALA